MKTSTEVVSKITVSYITPSKVKNVTAAYEKFKTGYEF